MPRKHGRVPLNIVLGLLMLYFLVPFWWLIVNSSKSSAGLFGGGSSLWFADDINYVQNFIDLFTYGGGIYARWLRTRRCTHSSAASARRCSRCSPATASRSTASPAGDSAFAILLGAVMVPTTALVIPTFVLFAQVGLDEHDLGGDPPDAAQPVRRVPHARLRARRGARRAAGCRTRRRRGGVPDVLQVALPLLRPAIVTVLLLSVCRPGTTTSCRSSMLSDNRLFPVTVGIGLWQSHGIDLRRRRRAEPVEHHRPRLPRLGHPADHRVPLSSAVLARRAGHRQPQVARPPRHHSRSTPRRGP